MALSLSSQFARAAQAFSPAKAAAASALPAAALFTGAPHDMGVGVRLLDQRLQNGDEQEVERQILADIEAARKLPIITGDNCLRAFTWMTNEEGAVAALADRPAIVNAVLNLMIDKNCRQGVTRLVERHGTGLQGLVDEESRTRMASYVRACANAYVATRQQPEGRGDVSAAGGLYKLLCASDGPAAGKAFADELIAALRGQKAWRRLCDDLCGIRAQAPADAFIDADESAALGAEFLKSPEILTALLGKFQMLFAEHLDRVPEPMNAARRALLPEWLATLRRSALNGDMDVAMNQVRIARQRLQMDNDALRTAVYEVIDDLLAEKKAVQASALIMQVDSLEYLGLMESLSSERAAGMMRGLAVVSDMKMIMFALRLRETNPSVADALGVQDDMLRQIEGPQILAGLAPIVTKGNNATYDLAAVIHIVQHRAMGAAQADALQDVWDALERADPAIPLMPELENIHPGEPPVEVMQGRPDIPFRAAELHKLSCDVSRLMNVVQTQIPIITADSISVDRMLDRTVTEYDEFSASRMDSSSAFVNGSATNVSVAENDERLKSRFGFIIVSKQETQDVDGIAVKQRKLVAMPIVTIDDDILAQTMDHGGEEMLRHLQMVGGIFNHDYFHHFTARIINPYFGFFRSNALEIQQTPYGIMMGAARDVPHTRPDKDETITALGIEQTARFNREKYEEPRWKQFNRVNTYEFHAMHLHNILYQKYMDDGETGQRLRGHVTGYMDELAALGDRLSQSGAKPRAVDTLKIYYTNLMAFHLLRLVPFNHPVMELLESKVEALDIGKGRLQEFVRRVLPDPEYSGHDSTLKRLTQRTGLAAERVANPEELSPAECVRACAFFAAERVLNPMYNPRYEEARGYALSALRQSVSVVQRDMKVVEIRGGEDVALKMMARQQRRADGAGPHAPMPA